MKLKELFNNIINQCYGSNDIEIEGLSYDSRKISKNYLFFALPGTHTDGAKFVNDAISKGAVCVVSNTKLENISCTNIVVDDIVHVMAQVSAKFYDYPDKKLTIVGVTGTNGKTSITYMVESLLKSLNTNIAVFGTINYRYADIIIDAPNTTPQSLDLYKMMADIVKHNIKYLIMEVSSHSLVLGRIFSIEFDIAVFTNLTQDHLDFHKTMENYFKAKKILFDNLTINPMKISKKFAIINSDDIYGKKLINTLDKNIVNLSYAINSNASSSAKNIITTSNGTSFDLVYNSNKQSVKVSHIGLHNIYNILASINVCLALGFNFNEIAKNVCKMVIPPGRLEIVENNKGITVVVDYAHTDDALNNVLLTLNKIKTSKLITVFGCGGNRDKTKRPKMAKVACTLSDSVIITSDNPREENPNDIVKDVEVGAIETNKNNYKIVIDRKQAIEYAIKIAQKGDIVLLAGKGHENYQIIGREKIHFDDKEIAKSFLMN